VAVAVLIEHGGHGSTSAAPIAREIIRTYLEVNTDHD
jgi:cell division protein FtsI/penicillin-binding protein 2